MPPNPISRRLASRLHVSQIESLRRANGTANGIDRTIAAAAKRIIGALADSTNPFGPSLSTIRQAIEPLWPEIAQTILAQLRAMAEYANKQAVKTLTATIPRPWWKVVIPDLPVQEAIIPDPFGGQIPPVPPFGIGAAAPAPDDFPPRLGAERRFLAPGVTADIEHEPILRGGLSKSEFDKLLGELIFPPPSRERIDRWVFSSDWAQRLGNLSRQIGDPQQVATQIAVGYAQGENVQQLTKRVQDVTGAASAAAKRIARTEAMRVAGNAQQDSFRQLGDLQIGFMHNSQIDQNSRPEHAALNGKIYYNDPEPGQSSVNEMVIEPGLTPRLPNCVLPGEAVSGRFQAALKAFYSGEVVEIVTVSGHRTTVTVNHPILTDRGFVAAGAIAKGDKLCCHVGKANGLMSMNDGQERPSLIENVFEAFRVLGKAAIAKDHAAFNLHGDAVSLQGQVSVVRPDLNLLADIQAETAKGHCQGILNRRHMEQPCLARSGSGAFHRQRISLSASRSLRRLHLGRAALALHAGPFYPLLFRGRAKAGAVLDKHSDKPKRPSIIKTATTNARLGRQFVEGLARVVSLDQHADIGQFPLKHSCDLGTTKNQVAAERFVFDSEVACETHQALAGRIPCDDLSGWELLRTSRACGIGAAANLDVVISQEAGDSVSADREFLGQLVDRFSGHVSFDDVTVIRRFHYRGPVFDLQADTGFYFSGQGNASIAKSNCRCWSSPVLAEPDEVRNDPRVKAEFENASGAEIPDPTAYDRWFQQADERTRKEAVGVRRYDLAKQTLGREPEWVDLIDKDGSLLSMRQIENTPRDEQFQRRSDVYAMLRRREQLYQQVSRQGFVFSR